MTRKKTLSYKEHSWNTGHRINYGVGKMPDMIDGPMLVGIAALITSIANVIVALRRRDLPADRPRSRRLPRQRNKRQNRRVRA